MLPHTTYRQIVSRYRDLPRPERLGAIGTLLAAIELGREKTGRGDYMADLEEELLDLGLEGLEEIGDKENEL